VDSLGFSFQLFPGKMNELESFLSQEAKREIKRNKFTHDEDERLVQLVEKFGSENWGDIAEELGTGRTKRQLRERWQSYLNPALNPQYSPEEDKQLQLLYEQYGSQWAKIAGLLGKKSAISARNRHRSLQSMKHKGTVPGEGEDSAGDPSSQMSDSERENVVKLNLSHLAEFDFPDIWAFGVGGVF
jgi:hypothetical protein